MTEEKVDDERNAAGSMTEERDTQNLYSPRLPDEIPPGQGIDRLIQELNEMRPTPFRIKKSNKNPPG